MALQAARVAAIVVLVSVAAALATPPGRLPLALRGVRKMLRRTLCEPEPPETAEPRAPAWRRAAAFLLVLAAAALAVL